MQREDVEALIWRVHESKAGREIRTDTIAALRALIDRAERAEAQVVAIARKFDEEYPDPALMARNIMLSIENECRAEKAEAERDAAFNAGRESMRKAATEAISYLYNSKGTLDPDELAHLIRSLT